MAKEYVLVTNDEDWEGMYINGKLEEEDHRISIASKKYRDKDVKIVIVDCEWLGGTVGNLPPALTDIPVDCILNYEEEEEDDAV